MKKFTKIALSLSAFFAIVGVVSIICAFAMGLTWNSIAEMTKDGKLSISFGNSNNTIHSTNSSSDHHQFDNDCSNLDIEISAGILKIYYDDVDEIEVEQNGISNFKSQVNGDTLQISGGKKVSVNNSDGSIIIVVPKGYVFEEVDMEIGAGQAEIDSLCAESLDIEVGAGQADFINLDVQYFNASAGAGQINAKLVGSESDYNYDVECGIGEIEIGESSFSGFAKDTYIENPGAKRELDIECGVGQIVISFQE